MTDLARSITPLTSLLATRPFGKQVWEKVHALLATSAQSAPVHLSFAGVDVMDASFADEVFGTLGVLRARRSEVLIPVVLEDLNETCVENLELALSSRPDREPHDLEKIRNCVLPVIAGTSLSIVGKLEDHLGEAFILLCSEKVLNAKDASNRLGIHLNVASTRLKTLVDLGLAIRTEVRDEQGKHYIYRWLL